MEFSLEPVYEPIYLLESIQTWLRVNCQISSVPFFLLILCMQITLVEVEDIPVISAGF